MTVDLTDQEWNQLMQIVSTAPWNVANPLLMKIGARLRDQALVAQSDAAMRADGKTEGVIERTREMIYEKARHDG